MFFHAIILIISLNITILSQTITCQHSDYSVCIQSLCQLHTGQLILQFLTTLPQLLQIQNGLKILSQIQPEILIYLCDNIKVKKKQRRYANVIVSLSYRM